MKIKFDRLIATFDVCEFLDELSPETRVELAESLALKDDIIAAVVDLLCDGSTAGGNWITHSSGDAIEKARVRLVEKFDPLRFELVERLLRDRKQAVLDREAADARRYEMQRWAEDWECPGCGRKRFAPTAPQTPYASVTNGEVAEALTLPEAPAP